MSFNTQLKELKEQGEDFEFYPTTEEMINAILEDWKSTRYDRYYREPSLLDVGAGNGKVLKSLSEEFDHLYAIEKSSQHVSTYDESIRFVGGDFWEQSLIDKKANVVFCNPPYSEYEGWVAKILKESNSTIVYLVIPSRWSNSKIIQLAISGRGISIEDDVKVIQSSDFLDSEDRKARAKVDVLRIDLASSGKIGDSFEDFFNATFAEELKQANENRDKEVPDIEIPPKGREITGKRSIVEILVEAYGRELQTLQNHYREVCKIPPAVLSSIETSLKIVKDCLREKLTGLKKTYWHELFDRMDSITGRLTSTTRRSMVDMLNENVGIDFTNGNAFEVVCWAVKNANKFFDSQFIKVYEQMVNKSSTVLYKSNKRVFTDDQWRYVGSYWERDRMKQATHYILDYRIVVSCCGRVVREGEFGYYSSTNGLSEDGATFLDDLMVIAGNLGYATDSRARDFDWKSGKSNTFEYLCPLDGEYKPLVEVKAFYNGNMHLRFNPDFILKMNIEHGRLKGWIKSPKEASEEMEVTARRASKLFNSTFKITPKLALMG